MSLLTIITRVNPLNVSTLAKWSKCLSAKLPNQNANPPIDPVTGKPKKPKTVPIPRITLVSGEQVSVSTLDEAQKIAKRRDLRLVKIVDLDTKTQRPIYKLMTGAEYHAEDLKQREEKKKERLNSTTLKGEKVLIINSKISEHDLQIHCNKILKWTEKRFEVRVLLHGDPNNMDKAESIFTSIEANLKSSLVKIVQKRQKGSEIRFQILPGKEQAVAKDEKAAEPKTS